MLRSFGLLLIILSASIAFSQNAGLINTLRKEANKGTHNQPVKINPMTAADSSAVLENLWKEKKWEDLKKRLSSGFNPNLPVFGHKHLLIKAIEQSNLEMCAFLMQLPLLDLQTWITLTEEQRDGVWIKEVQKNMTLLSYIENKCFPYLNEQSTAIVHFLIIRRGHYKTSYPNLAKIVYQYYSKGFPVNIAFDTVQPNSPLYYKVKILDTLIRQKYTLYETYLGEQKHETPIQFAALMSDTLMINRLLAAGADITTIKVHALLEKNTSPELGEYFVRKGINSFEDYESYYLNAKSFESYKLTPLQYCIWKKQDTQWISLLLAHSKNLEKPVLMSELISPQKTISLQKWMKENNLNEKNPEAYKKIMVALKSKK